MSDHKYRIIADLVTGMAQRAEDVALNQRADFLLDMLGAAFDAGSAHGADDMRRHAQRVGELTNALQLLVDELRYRTAPGFNTEQRIFNLISRDIQDRIARVMARDWRNE